MAYFSGTCPQWGPGFHIDADANDGRIRLAQCGRKTFALESTIRYSGTTGLEDVGLPPASLEELREVTPADLPETDLASIPPPMRWWVNSYGVHTPAAIIHDRFIGGDLPEGVTEQHIDRYFRFMLADAGVTIGKRWIMWSAVAMRTRWASGGARRVAVVLWLVAALAGTAWTFVSLWHGAMGQALIALVPLPLIASTLWQRQAGAAIIAAYFVFPLLLVPILMSIVLLTPFWAAEKIVSALLEPTIAGTEPVWEAVANDEKADERAVDAVAC